MTPKEKANELVDKFVDIDNDIFCSINYPYSKQCALIAIDEILNALKYPPNVNRQVVNINTLHFWQEVKQEIEKL